MRNVLLSFAAVVVSFFLFSCAVYSYSNKTTYAQSCLSELGLLLGAFVHAIAATSHYLFALGCLTAFVASVICLIAAIRALARQSQSK